MLFGTGLLLLAEVSTYSICCGLVFIRWFSWVVKGGGLKAGCLPSPSQCGRCAMMPFTQRHSSPRFAKTSTVMDPAQKIVFRSDVGGQQSI
jgi:hypothetical protein